MELKTKVGSALKIMSKNKTKLKRLFKLRLKYLDTEIADWSNSLLSVPILCPEKISGQGRFLAIGLVFLLGYIVG